MGYLVKGTDAAAARAMQVNSQIASLTQDQLAVTVDALNAMIVMSGFPVLAKQMVKATKNLLKALGAKDLAMWTVGQLQDVFKLIFDQFADILAFVSPYVQIATAVTMDAMFMMQRNLMMFMRGVLMMVDDALFTPCVDATYEAWKLWRAVNIGTLVRIDYTVNGSAIYKTVMDNAVALDMLGAIDGLGNMYAAGDNMMFDGFWQQHFIIFWQDYKNAMRAYKSGSVSMDMGRATNFPGYVDRETGTPRGGSRSPRTASRKQNLLSA